MSGHALKEEKYIDIEELLKESLSDTNLSEEKEDLVLEYLCQTISKTDSYESLLKKAQQNDAYAYIQLASWNIAHAKNIKDYCSAFRYAVKAAKAGYVEAYYLLGQMYLYGVGCTKNTTKAVKCLTFFVNRVPRKQLINETVLVDAYRKLAEAEKMMGHYDRAYQYYRELQELTPGYEKDILEMQKHLQDRTKEHTAYLLFTAVGFVVICAAIYFLANYMTIHTRQFLSKYPMEDKVTHVETGNTTTIEEAAVALERIEIQEPISYHMVSQDEFLALQLMELEIADATSSSEYQSAKGNDYSAKNLIDHDSSTTWQEGEEDAGVGQKLLFLLTEPAIISGMRIENGKQSSRDDYYANNRVASFIVFPEQPVSIELEDNMNPQYIVFENPILSTELEVTLESVFAGAQNDTCISQITLYE